MANFAVTITLVIASAVGAIYTTETNLRMLEVEAELAPALTLATGEKRPWVVNPMGIEKDFPAWGIACPGFSSNRSCAWKGLLPRREGDTITYKKQALCAQVCDPSGDRLRSPGIPRPDSRLHCGSHFLSLSPDPFSVCILRS